MYPAERATLFRRCLRSVDSSGTHLNLANVQPPLERALNPDWPWPNHSLTLVSDFSLKSASARSKFCCAFRAAASACCNCARAVCSL